MHLSQGTLSVDERSGIIFRPDTFDKWIVNETRGYFPLDIKPSDKILDIGGHIGAFASRAMSEKEVELTSIEAEESNYSILFKNADKFKFRSIYAAVVSDELDGLPITIYVNELKNNALHSTLETRGRSRQVTTGIGLKKLIDNLRPTIIKCDIEGGEFSLPWEALSVGSARMVIMELHLTRKGFRERAADILRRFDNMGFKLTKLPKIGEKNWTTLVRWER